MQISLAMSSAKKEFLKIIPDGCSMDHDPKEPIYIRVKVDSWPSFIHYEFRYNNKENRLFIELHVEADKYLYLQETFKEIRETVQVIEGLPVEYFKNRETPNFRKRPTLSIDLCEGVSGRKSAQVMSSFINATKEKVKRAIRF